MADDELDEAERRRREVTPIRSSQSFPVWYCAAVELADALERVVPASPEVLWRHARALELAATFKSWRPDRPPSDDDRIATIAAMLTFNTETRAFLAGLRRL